MAGNFAWFLRGQRRRAGSLVWGVGCGAGTTPGPVPIPSLPGAQASASFSPSLFFFYSAPPLKWLMQRVYRGIDGGAGGGKGAGPRESDE